MKSRSSRVTALILMLLISAVLMIYRAGWFDVSYIVRPETEGTDTGAKPESEFVAGTNTDNEEITDTNTDTESADTGSNTDSANADTGDSVTPPKFTPVSVAEAEDCGYELSYDEWNTGEDWILAALPMELPDYYSSGKHTVTTVAYEPQDRAPSIVVYSEKEEDKLAVTLYMGYVIIETEEENISCIYSSSGDLIGTFDSEEITPAMCRDEKDRPLFLYKEAYYYLDTKRGRFTQSDYDPTEDLRGARFDYTPDYGDGVADRTFSHSMEIVYEYDPIENKYDEEGFQLAYKIPVELHTYTLVNKYGTQVKDTVYYGAYAFSESRAAVVDEEGHLMFITRSGNVAVNPKTTRNDLTLGIKVYDFYLEPLTNGEESIGFYFFEHGLCRVRIMTVDRSRYNRNGRLYVTSEDDVLIYNNGDIFEVPEGYDIKSYSSGMILLEKNGKYGYMDYTGSWVVDPYLTYAEPFYEGLAVIGTNEGRALIDTEGNTVIPFGVYSHISHASTGVISAYGDECGWVILHKMQKD